MKNLNLCGKEYVLAPDGGSDCRGCLFDTDTDTPDRSDLCRAAPCLGRCPGNDGRGSFIIVEEAPVDTPTETQAVQTFADTDFLVGPPVAGRKDDSGKLDMTLLDDMPRALKAVVHVMQWAVTEKTPVPYQRGSWLGVHPDRYRAAIVRHGRDAAQQASLPQGHCVRFQRDHETNMLHLAHQATSALMALENVLRELEGTYAD